MQMVTFSLTKSVNSIVHTFVQSSSLQSVGLSVHRFVGPSVRRSVGPSVCQSDRQSVRQSVRQAVSQLVSSSVLSTHLSTRLSVIRSFDNSFSQSVDQLSRKPLSHLYIPPLMHVCIQSVNRSISNKIYVTSI